ncbi:MAG: alpha-isopropylmalate synthase regulatory domain-containing protein, partial [Bryobacteraceae bacterium]
CHNDSDVAVANTLAAVEAGVTHVQGCINGYGERCGNVNLCSVLANLELKLGRATIGPENLKNLTNLARCVSELANLPLRRDQPFVGPSAFAHKGGIHVSAVLKDSSTYEHIRPETVGNRQRVLVSQLSGRGNITYKLKQLGLADYLNEEARRELLVRIKHLEHLGYDFESADGTFELLVREAIHPDFHPFDVVRYEFSTRHEPGGNDGPVTTASVTLRVGDQLHSFTGTGEGPVHALDICLRRCLASTYPAITDVRLTDYKVRVLGAKVSTESKVRVLVEWSDHGRSGGRSWTTVGVSNNVIDASWRALVDALRLELIRLMDVPGAAEPGRDYSLAV